MKKKLNNPNGLNSNDFIKASKEYSDLGPLATAIKSYKSLLAEEKTLEEICQNPKEDQDIKKMARQEILDLEEKIKCVAVKIKKMLLPQDKDDLLNVIIEVRAGTGGEEAALFAASLFEMYRKYAERRNWKFEQISMSSTGIGGCKEALANINGTKVFSRLKFESGVHRVQRVPETESSGRIHTSTATVAVLPEPEDIDVEVNEKDLRIDVYRSSGPGGQSVNTTDSAVRITHIPTGIVVVQQDEKSQHKNKAKAIKILKARLYEIERAKVTEEISFMRKSQIGSGDRSEKTRTYNFPQGRITDHRIALTVHKINNILKEGDLDQLIDPIVEKNEQRILAQFESQGK